MRQPGAFVSGRTLRAEVNRSHAKSGTVARRIGPLAAIAGLSAGLIWFVPVYDSSLHDPRYLDGWILVVGMVLQLLFHIGIKSGFSPQAVKRWRSLHLLLGYVLIAAFASHCAFTLPDTAFEWALWSGFVGITASGAAAAFFSWSVRSKYRAEKALSFERIPLRRAELERETQAIIMAENPANKALGLPPAPYDAWISDLYANQLLAFFQRPRHASTHLIGSQRPLKQLINDIDEVLPYVDAYSRTKLNAIKAAVIEKDSLDFAHFNLSLSRGLLLLHVCATYTTSVLTVAHIIVVYSFASGSW